MRKLVHTVTQSDVGKNYYQKPDCKYCGAPSEKVFVGDVVGRFQRGDVGKRLYLVDRILYIENDSQLKARLAKGE